MKKTVVLPQPDINVISLSQIDSSKYFGVQDNVNTKKGVLIEIDIGLVRIFTLKCEGELLANYSSPKILNAIDSLLKNGHTVYQFDTIQELGKWLAEE